MGAIIDAATFRELESTAGADFVAELVDTFFQEAPGMLTALRKAQAAGDADAYRRAAHSLKSNSLTFGATALADAARAQELGGIGAAAAIDALDAEYARVVAALKELCNGA